MTGGSRPVLRKAAAVGRGSHTRIGKLEEVEETMSALWTRIENPAVQDLCIDWGMDAEFYPEIIPDLYAGEPLWLYARLPREPREVIVCGDLDIVSPATQGIRVRSASRAGADSGRPCIVWHAVRKPAFFHTAP